MVIQYFDVETSMVELWRKVEGFGGLTPYPDRLSEFSIFIYLISGL